MMGSPRRAWTRDSVKVARLMTAVYLPKTMDQDCSYPSGFAQLATRPRSLVGDLRASPSSQAVALVVSISWLAHSSMGTSHEEAFLVKECFVEAGCPGMMSWRLCLTAIMARWQTNVPQ